MMPVDPWTCMDSWKAGSMAAAQTVPQRNVHTLGPSRQQQQADANAYNVNSTNQKICCLVEVELPL